MTSNHLCFRRILLPLLLTNVALAVNAAPPGITYQPQNQNVLLNQQAAFGVIANGTTPLFYQWRKQGVPISGATNDQIVLPRSQFSDAGRYSVIVSNAESSLASIEAVLTVNSPRTGDIDCSFACGSLIDDSIWSVVLQPDGKLLVGGDFSAVNGAVRGAIARLNADGTTDHTFMNGLSGADGSVRSVALQSDGKVIIGGQFTKVNGVTRNGIARLNTDGALDSSFQNGLSGANNPIFSVLALSDGKVLIAGEFTTVNGVTSHLIARLNTDGTVDNTFHNGFADIHFINSMALQSDGKLVLGGWFTTVDGISRNGIARLNSDGTLDSSFLNGLSAAGDGYVLSVAVQTNGKVVVAGQFTAINGVSRTNVARLNADGNLDNTFQETGIRYGLDFTQVEVVAPQADGTVVIGGSFTTVNGVSRNYVARLKEDGTLDNAFLNGLSGANAAVYALTVQNNGDLLIGGSFTTVNGASRSRMARLKSDGTLDSPFSNGFSGPNHWVDSVAVQSDGRVLIGGSFTSISGVNRNGIARLRADGTLDPGFQDGLAGAADVNTVAVQTNGSVTIGGNFTNVNSVTRNRIARLNADGSLDNGFQNGLAGANNSVYSVAVQNDGKTLIGGQFTTVNGVNRNAIGRLHLNGTLDNGFLPTFARGPVSPYVLALWVQTDGKVLVGGAFNTVNSVARTNIARLNVDGSLDSSFQNGLAGATGPFAFPGVYSIAVHTGGKVLIGGNFTTVNRVSRNHFARLNTDGSLDTNFLSGLSGANGNVTSIAVQENGKIVIGGNFTTINGVSRNHLARLNSDGTLDNSFQNGLAGTSGGLFPYVHSVALQNNKVIIGGRFTAITGVPASYVARLWGSDSPPQIESINRIGEDLNLVWYAISNRTYRVQYQADLTASNWVDLAGDVVAAGPIANKADTTLGSATQRYYRVTLLP